MKFIALFFLISFVSFHSSAEVIEFAEDELLTETVMPVFDRVSVVKNRTISVAKRFEVGGGLGVNATEALYNNLIYSLSGAYHFDEIHGLNLALTFAAQGLSDMGQSLRQGFATDEAPFVKYFDPSRAPSPQYFLLGNYQVTAYYGKISLSKNTVMNLSLYGLVGLGIVGFQDNMSLAMNIGFGQKFYLTQNLALRLDLRLLTYQGPDPTDLKGDDNTLNPTPATLLRSEDFNSMTWIHTHLTAGLVYLL